MSLFGRRFGGKAPPPEETDGRRDALRRELARGGAARVSRRGMERPSPAAVDSGIELFQNVVLGLAPLAEALRMRTEQRDLERMGRADPRGDRPTPRLLRILDSMGGHATRLRERAEMMTECLGGVLDALGRLEEGELATRSSLSVLRERLVKSEDVEDLEELRRLLLEQASALIDSVEDRHTAIHAVAQTARLSQERARELEAALSDAEAEARTDPLTGLPNRRALEESVARRAAKGESTGVLAMDLDHFKRVNDTFGHDAGDAVLRVVGAMLRTELRGDDEAFRVGGEELLVLLSGSGWQGARATADRLRLRLAERAIAVGTPEPLRVTMSVGIAVWSPPQTFEGAREAADQALYRAKEAGRNRVMG